MKKLNEKDFTNEIYNFLVEMFPKYAISIGKNLLYKIIIDEDGRVSPKKTLEPARGSFAFQTDVLISNTVPLVAIEIKYNSLSTHDILTYSTKALKHKEIYPYLRYGLIVGNKERISRKFFTHNSGFDFALAIMNLDQEREKLYEIIQKQIRSSELYLELLRENRVKYFESNIKIKWKDL